MELTIYAVATMAALGVGLIERAGYWPENWKVQPRGVPKVTPL
ncbi:hypothetical protein MAE02_34870 [Microvirga aerophila]|uniref:Uncharacterized protein n=2 Tax=Microvirga aerophila TaxID=670291 RepID=A0A512BUZ7_9HYPH|nr:hypothetical protein MAE02_34870 [Microvirga aerophila]